MFSSMERLILLEDNPMSLVFQNIDPPSPSPPGECVPPAFVGGEDTLAGRRGGGGSIFWKTRDIGLASYSNNLSTYSSVYGDAQKVSKCILRKRGKYLSIYGETVNLGWFAVHKFVSEYAECINLIRRILGKNLCVNREHAKSLSALLLRQET
jgi:hypothetical protein